MALVVGIPNPAMNTPSDKATPLLRRVSALVVNAALLSCARQPPSERLRHLNDVIFDINPPFFWLYGGDKRGGNELTLPEIGLSLNLSSLWPLGQIKNGETQGV